MINVCKKQYRHARKKIKENEAYSEILKGLTGKKLDRHGLVLRELNGRKTRSRRIRANIKYI